MLEGVKELFKDRETYIENRISELKEEIANYKFDHQSRKDNTLEGVQRELKLLEKSLAMIIATENKVCLIFLTKLSHHYNPYF